MMTEPDQSEATTIKDEAEASSEILEKPGTSAGDPCEKCRKYMVELGEVHVENHKLKERIDTLETRLKNITNELEREVQRRCDLEQRFSEEAKRSTDQIDELVAKSRQDDAKLSELESKFESYVNETSSMIENFTTNREILTSQLLELRKENDHLLGRYIEKGREMQNNEINLPQTVEDLQFHCLMLNEKLLLATLAKEQLEETLIQRSDSG